MIATVFDRAQFQNCDSHFFLCAALALIMTTIYDPHWDQHLRLLVFASAAIANSGFVRRAFLPLFSALERVQCNTIAAAKELIHDPDCLEHVLLQLRSIFKSFAAHSP
jgi:hypothetical protein